MSNLRLFILLPLALFLSLKTFGQGIPRYFLDAPAFYLIAPDAKHIADRAGLGLNVAMNIATYNATLRFGGGAASTVGPKADDLGESVLMHYNGFVESGFGLYRSNGDRCAKDNRSAYTAMVVGGLRYDYPNKELGESVAATPNGFDYTVGAELGYFYIRDIIRNTEYTLRGDYFVKAKTVGAQFGIKIFFNLRGRR